MCGRYTVRSIQPVSELFGIALPPEFQPRFNIAPTQDVPVVRAGEGGRRADSQPLAAGARAASRPEGDRRVKRYRSAAGPREWAMKSQKPPSRPRLPE